MHEQWELEKCAVYENEIWTIVDPTGPLQLILNESHLMVADNRTAHQSFSLVGASKNVRAVQDGKTVCFVIQYKANVTKLRLMLNTNTQEVKKCVAALRRYIHVAETVTGDAETNASVTQLIQHLLHDIISNLPTGEQRGDSELNGIHPCSTEAEVNHSVQVEKKSGYERQLGDNSEDNGKPVGENCKITSLKETRKQDILECNNETFGRNGKMPKTETLSVNGRRKQGTQNKSSRYQNNNIAIKYEDIYYGAVVNTGKKRNGVNKMHIKEKRETPIRPDPTVNMEQEMKELRGLTLGTLKRKVLIEKYCVLKLQKEKLLRQIEWDTENGGGLTLPALKCKILDDGDCLIKRKK